MGITRILRICCLLAAMAIVCPPAGAQTTAAPFDDAEAQLRIRQAATAASAAAREADTQRKALETERQRVVQTDGERDLNQAAIRALEKDLQAAEAKQREQEASLKEAQDARARGLALRPQTRPTPVATAPPAPPQNYAELRRWCYDLRGTDDRHVIQGCDAVLLSTRESPQDHAVAFFNRGFAHKNRGQHDRAIEDYTQAIRLMPSMGLAFNGRGLAFDRKGLYDRAMLDFAEAIRLMPDSDFAFANRAAAALKLGQLDSAIADYDAALRIDPKNAASLYRRGLARRQKGDLAGGEADMAAAKAIQGDIATYSTR